MKRTALVVAIAAALPSLLSAQQEDTYDYWRPQRDMIRHGQQAILMCNGLFLSLIHI